MSHCEKEKQIEHCCDCPDRSASDVPVALNHWLVNFEFQGWRLWYNTLAEPGQDNRLCKYGRCRVCGKCLCIGVTVPTGQSADSFLATVYRWMYQLWKEDHLSYADVWEMFTALFHEEDRPFVCRWLSLPENRRMEQMYRHDAGGTQ